jgi:hypothetical protein
VVTWWRGGKTAGWPAYMELICFTVGDVLVGILKEDASTYR